MSVEPELELDDELEEELEEELDEALLELDDELLEEALLDEELEVVPLSHCPKLFQACCHAQPEPGS